MGGYRKRRKSARLTSSTPQLKFIAWRFYVVLTCCLLLVCLLLVRVTYLAVIQQGFLRHAGNARAARVVEDSLAFRGMIFDRNYRPLAVSVAAYALSVNPQHFNPNLRQLRDLCSLLELKPALVRAQLQQYKHHGKEFWYMRRGVSLQVFRAIERLHLAGLGWHKEYRRYYPDGETSAQLLGVTNIDDHGQEGLELWFDAWLRGSSGKKVIIKDCLGQVISAGKLLSVAHPGKDLVLSLDSRIQYAAYTALRNAVLEHQAGSGSVVVLDNLTGEILALVNYPSFNPNERKTRISNVRNNAISDLFEPGSTIKAFSIAAVLRNNILRPSTLIDTNPGWLILGKNMVQDAKNYGVMSLAQVLQVSSNVGTTKAVLTLAPQELWQLLQGVGFGEPSGIEWPSEKIGILKPLLNADPFAMATLSFGYGMTANAVQLTRAYSVFANHGVKLPVTIMRRESAPAGEPVLTSQLAGEMLGLLEQVVTKDGTGKLAQVPGYRVAGKTGTVRVLGAHGYDKHRHNALFVGIAPASKPRLVITVVINDLGGSHASGGSVAAKVFAVIMAAALRTMNVAPDNAMP